MKIRAAALSDHKELAHLSKVLGYPIEEEVLIEGLKRIIAEEDHLLLVAEIEGKAVGMIEAQPYSTVYSAGRFFNVLGLVVDDQVQKQGVGGNYCRQLKKKPDSEECTAFD
nr:GNAT family N-acetyltransferase [Enterococcus innesii]